MEDVAEPYILHVIYSCNAYERMQTNNNAYVGPYNVYKYTCNEYVYVPKSIMCNRKCSHDYNN